MRILIAGVVDLPPKRRDEAIAGAEALIEEARGEPGCVAYDWTPDPFLPGRIHVYEEWTGEAELAAHLKAPSYTGMLAHLGGIGILNAVTQKYRVDHFEPVYDPKGVPRADFFTEKA